MSDFGTMITIRRRDGAHVDEQDRAAVERVVAPLRSAAEHTDFLAEPFRYRIDDAHIIGGVRGLSVLLSEYWGEMEDEDSFDPDEVLASDAEAAQEVLAALQPILDETFELELIADHW